MDAMRILALLLALFLPAYNTLPPVDVAANSPYTVWNAETPTPGNGTTAASQQVALTKNKFGVMAFSVDGKFSAAPGAFEVDVQVAQVDSDTNYQTISNGNITAADSTNNGFHLDVPRENARFARLLLRSRTNAVSITATVSQ